MREEKGREEGVGGGKRVREDGRGRGQKEGRESKIKQECLCVLGREREQGVVNTEESRGEDRKRKAKQKRKEEKSHATTEQV